LVCHWLSGSREVDGSHPVLLEAALSGKKAYGGGRVGEGWQHGRHDSICGFLPLSRNSRSWLKKDSWEQLSRPVDEDRLGGVLFGVVPRSFDEFAR
jgi:hypothetical protein